MWANFRNYIVWLMVAIATITTIYAQTIGVAEQQYIFRSEWNGSLSLTTSGFSLGYRRGKQFNSTMYRKHLFEVEGSYIRHNKEVRSTPYSPRAHRFIYGKRNTLFTLRGGYGQMRVLTTKPYWGGVELRWLTIGGASLGFAIPYYIYRYRDDYSDVLVAEAYDPDKHNWGNIYGRGPYFKGISSTTLHPGVYLKTALNAEFSRYQSGVRSLELGAMAECLFIPVDMMAFNDKKSLFLSLYVSYLFGAKREY